MAKAICTRLIYSQDYVIRNNSLLGEVVSIREYRVNEKIKGKEVRVIGENGEKLGVMTVRDALQTAREKNTISGSSNTSRPKKNANLIKNKR